jgi:hypothetical protein
VTGSNSGKYRKFKSAESPANETGATASHVGIQVTIQAINILNISQKKT